MSTVTAPVIVAPGAWVNIGTGPLIARLPAPDSGLFVELRIQDSAPSSGALPHRMLGGENHVVEIGDANGVWAFNVSGSGASVTLDVTTGLTPAGGSSSGPAGSNGSVGSTGAAVPSSATAVGFQNAAGNLVLPTPSAGLPVADSGAAITGATIPAGGVGLTGWLSAIWSKLSSQVATSAGNAGRAVISDPSSGVGAFVSIFHNADNQALGTVYGILTGGVDELVNGSGNLDRKRGVSGDAMAITGLAAEVPMVFNGSSYDRLRSVSGDAASSTGIVQEAVALWNGATYDRWYGDKSYGAWVNIKSSATIPTTETYAYLATAQVSVAATATLIVAARTGRKEVTIVNHGTTAVYLGPSGVATTTGQLLAGVAGEGITYSGGAAVYGIAATGSQTVSVAEVY